VPVRHIASLSDPGRESGSVEGPPHTDPAVVGLLANVRCGAVADPGRLRWQLKARRIRPDTT
jgi:hypothetical protein